MSAFQNGQTRIVAVLPSRRKRLHVDTQPSTLDSEEKDSSERAARHSRTLRADVVRLSAQEEDRAESLIKQRCTRNERLHWQTRGRQALLRQAATHLLKLADIYRTEYTLFLALEDYLGCLEKYVVDEEPCRPMMNRDSPIMQWKREGVARELSKLQDRLVQLLKRHPFQVEHMLSFDGKGVVALRE
jgi:hypothetical protein